MRFSSGCAPTFSQSNGTSGTLMVLRVRFVVRYRALHHNEEPKGKMGTLYVRIPPLTRHDSIPTCWVRRRASPRLSDCAESSAICSSSLHLRREKRVRKQQRRGEGGNYASNNICFLGSGSITHHAASQYLTPRVENTRFAGVIEGETFCGPKLPHFTLFCVPPFAWCKSSLP